MNIINIILLFLIILNSISLGKLFLKKFKDTTYLEHNLFAISLGLSVLSYITFFSGVIGQLYTHIFWIILTSLTIIFAKENIKLIISLKKIFTYEVKNYYILTFLLFSLFLTFLISLSPSTYWDELHYHLTVPKIYIQNHKIVNIPELLYSHFPAGCEMLFLFCMLLSDDILANLVHWLYGMLCAMLIFVIGRRFYSVQIGILSATIFFTIPTVMKLSSLAYVDLALSFYIALSFYSIMLWNNSKDNKYFYLSSIFLGIAFSVKHNAIIGLVLIITFILCNFKDNLNLKNVFLFCTISFLIPLPYYLKSQYFTGNPVYPFLYNIFGGSNLTQDMSWKITQEITEFGVLEKGIKEFLFFPWNLTVHHQKFWGMISPLYLGFVPLILFFKKDKTIKTLLFFGLGYLIILFFLSQQIRLLIPSLISLSIVCGFIAYNIKEKFGKFIWQLSTFFITVSFVFSICFIFWQSYFRFYYTFGIQTKDEFLTKYLDVYPVCKFINKNLSQDSKIFFINDRRIYYLNRDFIIPYFQNYFLTNTSAQKRYKYLKEKNITHIVFNALWMEEPQKDILFKVIMQDKEQKYLKLLFKKNNIYLFEIK